MRPASEQSARLREDETIRATGSGGRDGSTRSAATAHAAWKIAIVLALALTFVGAGAADEKPSGEGPGMAGLELVYRFPNGRTYRAEYSTETVFFVLLEPSQVDPPSRTMAYSSRKLRDDLFLVVWNEPEFHTTFAIDLHLRQVHASALREGQGSFLGTAEIIELVRSEP
jgi:hypothetical protein